MGHVFAYADKVIAGTCVKSFSALGNGLCDKLAPAKTLQDGVDGARKNASPDLGFAKCRS